MRLLCDLKRFGSDTVGPRKESRDLSAQRAHSTTLSAQNRSCLRMKRIVAQSSPMNWDGFTALRGDPSKQIRKPGAFS
jgi:hypothetical protein